MDDKLDMERRHRSEPESGRDEGRMATPLHRIVLGVFLGLAAWTIAMIFVAVVAVVFIAYRS